jgi:competence protein ComEA
MKLPLSGSDVARGSRGVGAAAAAAAGSPWGRLVAKVLLVTCGLATLAGIGVSRWAGEAGAMTTPMTSATATATETTTATATATATVATAATAKAIPTTTGATTASGATACAAPRASPEDPVTLNTATLDDLRRLPGIGPRKAQAILAERQRVGRFRKVEDLMKVKGIGRGTIKKLRPLVQIDPPAESDAGTDR